jgi:hypothetical protein
MLALNPIVVDAVWQSFAAYLPKRGQTNHPLGCHRPRISDRDCFKDPIDVRAEVDPRETENR